MEKGIHGQDSTPPCTSLLADGAVGYHEDGSGGATIFALTATGAAFRDDFGRHGQPIDVDAFRLANLNTDEAAATDIGIDLRDSFGSIAAIVQSLFSHTNPICPDTR